MKRISGLLVLIPLFLLLLSPAAAQDTTTSSPIAFSGTVEAISGTQITVSGLVVDVSAIDPAVVSQIVIDAQIEISGTLSNGVVAAVTVLIVSIPPPPPVTVNGFVVIFGGVSFNGTSTTFTYVVSGTGTPPDLSHFDLQIPACTPTLSVTAYSPAEAVSFGVDPTTGIDGIKWDLPLSVNDSRTYSITFAGNVSTGVVQAAVKGGTDFATISLPGPACERDDNNDDLPVVIIIEGPVQAINVNIITIFGINIEIDIDNPLLTVIRVGDIVRVEGGASSTNGTLVIVAVTIVIINVEVYVGTTPDQVWRDDGSCANPPPDWAPAVGWRRRCEGRGPAQSSGRGRNSRSS